jgi:LysM repeat protein
METHMQSKPFKAFSFTMFVGISLILLQAINPAGAQGENLLSNPSFEGQFSGYTPETAQELADCPIGMCNTAQLPSGWKPWWVKERPTDVNPEFKPADLNAGGNRVLDGQRAAQYFSFWSTHKAGLRQTVAVPAGSTLEFSVWGHSWMSESDTSLVSDYSGTPNMRIGIDPTGGTNVYSPSIIWSGFLQPFDQYQRFSVTAQAQGDNITVFTYSAPSVNPNSPDYGFKHTDVYWDNAALTVVGAGSAAVPPPPANSGGSEPAPVAAAPYIPGPTATPNAEGVIYTEVQAGDSLWAVAARAGLVLDELLEINEMSRDDIIKPGDLLIVGYGDPPSAESTEEEASSENESGETGTDVEVDESSQLPIASSTVEASGEGDQQLAAENSSGIVSSQKNTGASICLEAYDDANQNGINDMGETLRPAVAFTISDGQSVVSNYVTDGDSEPFCIKGLPEGSYRVTRSGRPEEIMTTPGDRAVSVADASTLHLSFGSYISDDAVAFASGQGGIATANSDNMADPVEEVDGMGGLIIGAVVVALLLLVAVVVVILTSRRNTVESS